MNISFDTKVGPISFDLEKQDWRTYRTPRLAWGLILSYFGVLFLIVGFAGIWFALLGGLICVSLGVLLLVRLSVAKKLYPEAVEKHKKEVTRIKHEEKLKKNPTYVEEDFYKACKKANVYNTNTSNNVAGMKKIAKKQGLDKTSEELFEMYSIGEKSLIKKEQEKIIKKELSGQKKIEKEHKAYMKYAGLERYRVFINKQIAKSRAKIRVLEQNKQTALTSIGNYYNLSKQNEYDAAGWGSIAGGLAGPAAGIITAIDIEADNQDAREYNSQLASSLGQLGAQAIMNTSDAIEREKCEISLYKENLGKLDKIKLANATEQELLDALKLKATAVNKLSGAVRIDITANSNSFRYLGNNYSIDGTIKVILKHEDEVVGETYASFPMGGNIKKSTLETYCIKPKKSAKEYKILFEPYCLWAIPENKLKNLVIWYSNN